MERGSKHVAERGPQYIVVRDANGDDHIVFGPGEELLIKGGLPSEEVMLEEAIRWMSSHTDQIGTMAWNYRANLVAVHVVHSIRDLDALDAGDTAKRARELAAAYRSAADQLEAYAAAAQEAAADG